MSETSDTGSSGDSASSDSSSGGSSDAAESDANTDAGGSSMIDGSARDADSAAPILCCNGVACTGNNWVGNGTVECGQLSEANVGAACYVPSSGANSIVAVCP